MSRYVLPLLVVVAPSAVGRAGSAPTPSGAPAFNAEVRPIFHAYGTQCRAEAVRLKGGLDLRLRRTELDGKPFAGQIKYDKAAQASSRVLGSPWKFARHGQSGIELAELLPHLAGVVDDIPVVRSMTSGVNNHVQATHTLNTGRILSDHPVLGSWLCYGLGAQARQLPAFVALPDPVSHPVGGTDHRSNGWLPSVYQGAAIRSRGPRIASLDPPQLKGPLRPGCKTPCLRARRHRAVAAGWSARPGRRGAAPMNPDRASKAA